MRQLISSLRGLTVLKTLVQIAAYVTVMWTTAESRGLGDEFVQGLRSVPQVVIELLRGVLPRGARD